MFNARTQNGDVRARIVAVSSNGGVKWDTTYFENTFCVNVGIFLVLKSGHLQLKIAAFTKLENQLLVRLLK